MATIQKRETKAGASYTVTVRKRGAKPQTATFRRLTDAKKWARQTEAAIEEGRFFNTAEARRRTVADLIERYVEDVLPTKSAAAQKKQAPQLAWWASELGHLSLVDCTPSALVAARDGLAKGMTSRGRRSPATVNRYLAILSHAFTKAVREWEWLTVNPMGKVDRLTEARGRVRYLDELELKRLLSACEASRSRALYPVVVLALSTGMRQGEILGLRWRDVDLERCRLTLEDTKNGERRGVPLANRALARLREHARLRRLDTDLVFPGTVRAGRTTKPANIRNAWERAVAVAELEDFRFHDLRHTAASYLAMNGATLAEIAEVLGHKTLAMVKRYAHLSPAHTAGVVERMNAAVFGD